VGSTVSIDYNWDHIDKVHVVINETGRLVATKGVVSRRAALILPEGTSAKDIQLDPEYVVNGLSVVNGGIYGNVIFVDAVRNRSMSLDGEIGNATACDPDAQIDPEPPKVVEPVVSGPVRRKTKKRGRPPKNNPPL